MTKYDILPLKGVGPISFGMTRAESRKAMGLAPREVMRHKDALAVDVYHVSAFQVFFDGQNHVEFVELSSSKEYTALFNKLNPHKTKAKDLLSMIQRIAPYDPEGDELGHTYTFPELELGVWRPVTENEYFTTIGIGRKGYYSS